MSVAIPRLRMFAGPNGSGKSTIKEVIAPQLLGVYINPDEIEKDIRRFDFLDFSAYRIATTAEEVLPFFQQSTLLTQTGFADEVDELRFKDGKLSFHAVPVNAYFASVAADFIRQKLLDVGITFTFETVMSSPDKVAFLKKAQGTWLSHLPLLYCYRRPNDQYCPCGESSNTGWTPSPAG
jgi:predicted ABC-type ATPase